MPISPEQLFDQLVESVALLAETPEAQLRWVTEHRYRVDELVLDFMTSTWPLFSPRLHEHGLLDDRADRALNELHDYLKSIADDAHEGLFTLDGVNNTEEWEHVRGLARAALVILHITGEQ